MLLQHLLEVPACMTGGMLCSRFRDCHHHNLAALIAPIGSEIKNPAGAADYIEIVLDHPHNSRPRPANAAAHLKQEEAATSAAGAWDFDSSVSDAPTE